MTGLKATELQTAIAASSIAGLLDTIVWESQPSTYLVQNRTNSPELLQPPFVIEVHFCHLYSAIWRLGRLCRPAV